ncbi:hypothetical protein HK407_02g03730 [Ordospora pajunii]|uniref:uncharacterized protein n=1 Tax=Ordospora pajunii TaxID=3039483 RepID=UPI00295280DD|nr:uncharacterized protein HK407_02g03730 [Ordospora pajunii]KAH9411928.1 hypothetical protein HK407_02g03730 [Ordospora pajunii]
MILSWYKTEDIDMNTLKDELKNIVIAHYLDKECNAKAELKDRLENVYKLLKYYSSEGWTKSINEVLKDVEDEGSEIVEHMFKVMLVIDECVKNSAAAGSNDEAIENLLNDLFSYEVKDSEIEVGIDLISISDSTVRDKVRQAFEEGIKKRNEKVTEQLTKAFDYCINDTKKQSIEVFKLLLDFIKYSGIEDVSSTVWSNSLREDVREMAGGIADYIEKALKGLSRACDGSDENEKSKAIRMVLLDWINDNNYMYFIDSDYLKCLVNCMDAGDKKRIVDCVFEEMQNDIDTVSRGWNAAKYDTDYDKWKEAIDENLRGFITKRGINEAFMIVSCAEMKYRIGEDININQQSLIDMFNGIANENKNNNLIEIRTKCKGYAISNLEANFIAEIFGIYNEERLKTMYNKFRGESVYKLEEYEKMFVHYVNAIVGIKQTLRDVSDSEIMEAMRSMI